MNLAKNLAGVLRPALVLLLAFLIFGSVVLAYPAIRTLQQLNAIETERDRWQRADDLWLKRYFARSSWSDSSR